MRVHIDTELDGLGDALAKLLPDGVTPTSLHLTKTRLRVEGKVRKSILSKTVALVADVDRFAGGLRVRGFAIEGAMGLGDGALADLKTAIAKLDERIGGFRVKGGDGIVVSWGPAR
jgi:hypothetical protein